MYLYYDVNGNLQEQINDTAIIEGETCNKIYCYFDGLDLSGKRFFLTLKKPDGTFVPTKNGISYSGQIPYNSTRDLRYFEYYKTYSLIEFDLNSDSDLTVVGVYYGNPQISATDVNFYNPITFNVESNNITANVGMTASQYAYLLSQVQGNIYSNGITGNYSSASGLTITIETGTGATASTQIALPFYSNTGGIIDSPDGNTVIGVQYYDQKSYVDCTGLTAIDYDNHGAISTKTIYGDGNILFTSGGRIYPISLPESTGTIALQSWVQSTLSAGYASLTGNNAFTGTNSFGGITTFNGDLISNGTSHFSATAFSDIAAFNDSANFNDITNFYGQINVNDIAFFNGAVTFSSLPKVGAVSLVSQGTLESDFNSSFITASDVANKLGSTPVAKATYADTAGTTLAQGQPVSLSTTFASGTVVSTAVPFIAGSSYYGILYFNQATLVQSGGVGAYLKLAGVTSSTAFTSDGATIYFRIEVSYLRTAGRYVVSLTNLNSGVSSRTYLTSVPTNLVEIGSSGSSFVTEGGAPYANIAGTLQIIS